MGCLLVTHTMSSLAVHAHTHIQDTHTPHGHTAQTHHHMDILHKHTTHTTTCTNTPHTTWTYCTDMHVTTCGIQEEVPQ